MGRNLYLISRRQSLNWGMSPNTAGMIILSGSRKKWRPSDLQKFGVVKRTITNYRKIASIMQREKYFGLSPRIARWKLDKPLENWLSYRADHSSFFKRLYLFYYSLFDRSYQQISINQAIDVCCHTGNVIIK